MNYEEVKFGSWGDWLRSEERKPGDIARYGTYDPLTTDPLDKANNFMFISVEEKAATLNFEIYSFNAGRIQYYSRYK